jgi:hypothetical protein
MTGRGAQRGPYRDLTESFRPSGRAQAGHVGAGDEEHESDGAHEHETGRPNRAKYHLAQRAR